MRRGIFFILFYFLFSLVEARVRLPKFFSDNMVLQQQSECKLWGWAEPGKKILVDTPWDKQSYSATARKDGYFQVKDP